MNPKPERFPFDYEALSKGDTITTYEIERVLSINANHPAFRLALLGLREQLLKSLAILGKHWTVTTERNCLNILTDEEASVHNARLFASKERSMKRDHWRQLNVDQSNLSDIQRDQHERTLIVQSLKLAALKQTRKEIRIALATRSTPGLTSTDG